MDLQGRTLAYRLKALHRIVMQKDTQTMRHLQTIFFRSEDKHEGYRKLIKTDYKNKNRN